MDIFRSRDGFVFRSRDGFSAEPKADFGKQPQVGPWSLHLQCPQSKADHSFNKSYLMICWELILHPRAFLMPLQGQGSHTPSFGVCSHTQLWCSHRCSSWDFSTGASPGAPQLLLQCLGIPFLFQPADITALNTNKLLLYRLCLFIPFVI